MSRTYGVQSRIAVVWVLEDVYWELNWRISNQENSCLGRRGSICDIELTEAVFVGEEETWEKRRLDCVLTDASKLIDLY